MDEENRLNFMLNAVNILNLPSQSVIKNHMLSEGKSIASSLGLSLPNKFNQKSSCCEYCHSLWSDGQYSVILSPEKKFGSRIKRLFKKSIRKKKLNNFESSLLQNVHEGNTLIFRCDVCTNKTTFLLKKPEKIVEQFEEINLMSAKKKKKKKKKDRFSGLSPAACQTSTPLFISLNPDSDIEIEGETSGNHVIPLGSTPYPQQPEEQSYISNKTPIVKSSVRNEHKLFFSKLTPSCKKPKQKLLLNPFAHCSTPIVNSSAKKMNKQKVLDKLNKKQTVSNKPSLKDFLSLL